MLSTFKIEAANSNGFSIKGLRTLETYYKIKFIMVNSMSGEFYQFRAKLNPLSAELHLWQVKFIISKLNPLIVS